MRRRRARIFAAILVCFGVLVGWVLLEGIQDPNRLPSRDWRLFKRNFLSHDGRIIDTGNNGITHSEGQAYGMLLAVAYRDRAAFDRIWTWTQKNLQKRADKLLSWQWVPDDKGGGTVPDPNNASDGDLMVAWALLRASRLWGDFRYQQQAAQILSDLARLDVKEMDDGLLLLPATDGFSRGDDGFIVNLSYYVFPALQELSQAFPSGPWGKLYVTGQSLLERARFGKWNLTPDWVLDGKTCKPAEGFAPVFGYNAVRIPLNLAWGVRKPNLLAPFADFWRQFPKAGVMPDTVDVETGEFGPYPAIPGVQAIAVFTIARFGKQNLTVKAIPAVTKEEPYFSASLKILTKLAICESVAAK